MTRALLTLATVAVLGLLFFAMWKGWQHRGARQQWVLGAYPSPPEDPGPALLGPDTGLFVGMTVAGDWQDRVAVGDLSLRAAAELSLHAGGVLCAREGASDLWVPRQRLVGARTAQGLAGKVMTRDGLLVLRWAAGTGDTAGELDLGFRADDKGVYADYLAALAPGAGPTDSTPPSSTDTTEEST